MNDQAKRELTEVIEGPKISKENATAIFNKLVKYYDVDPEDFGSRKDLKSSFEYVSTRLIRAIKNGDLEIKDENGTPIVYQHLRKPPAELKGSTIKYKELDGNCRAAMKDTDNDNMRNQMLIAALIGEDVSIILNFKSKDLSIAEYLASFFMTV